MSLSFPFPCPSPPFPLPLSSALVSSNHSKSCCCFILLLWWTMIVFWEWLSHNTSTQIFVMLFTPSRCNATYFYGIWKWVDSKGNEQLLMTVDTKLCLSSSFMLVSLIILLWLWDYTKNNEVILNYYLLPHPKTCIVRHLWAATQSIFELWRLFSAKTLHILLTDFICRK